MFYRRKIILSILQAFGYTLDKTQFQKLLFLFTIRQENPAYFFIPYKYGCYSFSANADLGAMEKKGIISEIENKIVSNEQNINYVNSLTAKDKYILQSLFKLYETTNRHDLIKQTYINYSYYAIKSEIAQDILTKEEYTKVLKAKPINNKTALYTIGYEGNSLEEYLNKLIKNDIKLLCDVRKNALSMKYGFSKSTLKKMCENVGIKYVHIPELGINSEYRTELKSQDDYDILFEFYKSENLTNTTSFQQIVLNYIKEYKRVAITCFEAEICQCHRKPLAEAISQLKDWNYELIHI